MYGLRKFFNYATLILAICSIITIIFVVMNKLHFFVSLTFMIVTLIFNGISRIYNDRDINLNSKDKEILGIKDNKKS